MESLPFDPVFYSEATGEQVKRYSWWAFNDDRGYEEEEDFGGDDVYFGNETSSF